MGLALVCIIYSGTFSYTDPMGLALVYIIYSEPQLYRSYGTGTSLYNILSYTDPMGLAQHTSITAYNGEVSSATEIG